MNRAAFLKSIIAFGIGSKIPGRLRNYKKIYLLECFVAGFQYYDGPEQLGSLDEGDLLQLRREHNNEVDRRAIAVYHKANKIGYIPQRENKTLSRLIDADVIPLIAEITHIRQDVASWENIRISVYLLKEQSGMVPDHTVYLTKLREPKYRSLAALP